MEAATAGCSGADSGSGSACPSTAASAYGMTPFYGGLGFGGLGFGGAGLRGFWLRRIRPRARVRLSRLWVWLRTRLAILRVGHPVLRGLLLPLSECRTDRPGVWSRISVRQPQCEHQPHHDRQPEHQRDAQRTHGHAEYERDAEHEHQPFGRHLAQGRAPASSHAYANPISHHGQSNGARSGGRAGALMGRSDRLRRSRRDPAAGGRLTTARVSTRATRPAIPVRARRPRARRAVGRGWERPGAVPPCIEAARRMPAGPGVAWLREEPAPAGWAAVPAWAGRAPLIPG